MSKKRAPTGLPPFVRRHGLRGFRAVVNILHRRRYGPTFPTPELASQWAENILRDAEHGEVSQGPMTLEDGLRALLQDLRDTGGRDGTRAYYSRAFGYVVREMGAGTRLCDVDATAIRHYLERRRAQGVGDATIVKKELGTLRRITRLAVVQRAIAVDPFVGLKLPRIRMGRFEAMTAPEVEDAIAKITNRRHADIVEVFWRTGLRRAEVVRLRVGDVNLQRRDLFIDGKTGNRYVPIAKAIVPALERLIAEATDGRLVDSFRMIERLFDRWKKRLALRAFSPHVMRHSFITDCLSRGVPLHEVAKLVGHSSTRMLDRYFHAMDGRLRAAVDGLGEPRETSATQSSAAAGPGRQGDSAEPPALRRGGSARGRRSSRPAGTASARSSPADAQE